MNINLHQIDELRDRSNVGYREAKEALQRFDGNIVEALAYLEQNKSTKQGLKKTSNEVVDTASDLVDKGFKTRVLVKKNGIVKLNVSANTAIIFGIVGFHAVILAGIVGLLTNHRLSIEKCSGVTIDLNDSIKNYSDK